jgi:hypothetical protein
MVFIFLSDILSLIGQLKWGYFHELSNFYTKKQANQTLP